MQIPLLDLGREYEYIKKDIKESIQRCFKHQRWIFGPEVRELEERIAKYIGTKYAVGVASGTDALLISLRALAIKTKGKEFFDKKDLIITTPFTFTSTGEVILRAGATPVFIDIDPDTYNIDPTKIREYLHALRLTPHASQVVGIIPVHLFGNPCNMDEIIKIAKENNLFVLEDCAQSFGAIWKNKKTGSFGNISAFSFFPSKNLGGFGDGGVIVTDDEELFEKSYMLRNHGGKDKYNVEHIGYNSRLDTIQASILLTKLKYVDEFNEKRRKIAEMYEREFKKIRGVITPKSLKDAYHVYHQYTIRISEKKRDEIQKEIKNKGISTAVYYYVPLHKMKVFKEKSIIPELLKETEKASREVLSLPIEPLLKKEEISFICKNIKEMI